jgi:hypothetical protein
MVNINCKTTGSIAADGSAKMEVIQIETVVLDTPHETFNVQADPFTHFSLAEEASGASAEFTVSIVSATALQAALGGWLKAAGAKNAGAKSVEEYMIEYLRGEINALVDQDGVGAALEAHVIKDLSFNSFEADAQTGANNLVTDLSGNQEHKNLIGLQFPASRYGETFSAALPAQSGDSMTFQFTITSNILVSDEAKDLVASEANAATQAATSNILDVTKSRIVHIVATKA